MSRNILRRTELGKRTLLAVVFALFALTLSFGQPLPQVPVEPLLKTIRVQTAPYNRSCPYYNYGDSVSSEPCLVGCVATALEQLLSYYRYPEALLDSIPGWETDNYSISTVPAGSRIDWEDVADLSLWCGMMVKMKYSPNASAASLSKAEESLRRVFGYKTVKILDRSLYSFDAWHRILQNEMLAGRPVAYVGFNNMMRGHAFNIDGMDENGLFHCNWGEGEGQNGYFSLEHLCQLQPYWDATDWGRMIGYHANEYMLILHPDSVTDVLELDTLQDFANAVRVEDITLRRQMTSMEYVLTDVHLTNLTTDTLYHTYEILLNSPSDTAILDQCKEICISSVKMMPGETRTHTVAAHYPVPAGEWILGITFDGKEVPFRKSMEAVSPSYDKLLVYDGKLTFPTNGSVSVELFLHNAAALGTSGRLLYFKLFKEGEDNTCSRDYRVMNLPAGETVCDTLRFNRLEPETAYRLEIGPWGTPIHTVSFVMPKESTGIDNVDVAKDGNLPNFSNWYDMNGRKVLFPEKGVYIKDGKKVYYGGN